MEDSQDGVKEEVEWAPNNDFVPDIVHDLVPWKFEGPGSIYLPMYTIVVARLARGVEQSSSPPRILYPPNCCI
jgi:hypothetical protein